MDSYEQGIEVALIIIFAPKLCVNQTAFNVL